MSGRCSGRCPGMRQPAARPPANGSRRASAGHPWRRTCDSFRGSMDYKKLRDMVSHRVTFEFDTGAKVVGYIASCVPANGPVQMLVLSKVQVLDASQQRPRQVRGAAAGPEQPDRLPGHRGPIVKRAAATGRPSLVTRSLARGLRAGRRYTIVEDRSRSPRRPARRRSTEVADVGGGDVPLRGRSPMERLRRRRGHRRDALDPRQLVRPPADGARGRPAGRGAGAHARRGAGGARPAGDADRARSR